MTVVALAILAGSSWALGSLALSRVAWPDLRGYERASLRLTAGLGLTALLLALLTLGGFFSATTSVLSVLAVMGAALALRSSLTTGAAAAGANRRPGGLAFVLIAAVGCACLGALAPVTDDDALSYVVPIARHIAQAGALRVWPDQARAVYPQSQEVLLAWVLHIGGERLGALTALQCVLAVGVVSALARRICQRAGNIAPALVLAFGAPVVAFQIASAKEDLLLVALCAAAATCLSAAGSLAELAAAGLFAGLAAGTKYSGLGVALAAVAWPLVGARKGRLRAAAIVALAASASGGLWYALNYWRFGNPIAPFIFGARGTTFDTRVARILADSFGAGRSPLALIAAPARIFVEPSLFCGRANLYNPLVYAGLAGLMAPSIRRRSMALYIAVGVLYVGWFFSLQNARLLLPAAVLLAPSAADVLMPIVRTRRLFQAAAGGVAAVSLGVVAAVGVVRAARYLDNPSSYLERETQHYDDILWMNTHLDRARHRVGSDWKAMAYLEVPWLILDPTFQTEIHVDELEDPDRFLAACRRQGITHLFGSPDRFAAVRVHLRPIHENPVSRLGGQRFFREPPNEPTVVFELRN